MKIEDSKDLDAAIEALEHRKKLQEAMLSDSFHTTVDHFRPVNLIKTAFKNATEKSGAGSSILKAAGGIGAGFLAKNLILGKPTSIIGKLAAGAIKMGAGNTVINNSDKITAWGTAIYNNLFKKKHQHHPE